MLQIKGSLGVNWYSRSFNRTTPDYRIIQKARI